jgi:glutamate N-acetyltransferase/amino-acid N-acetyltransferase
MAAPRYTVTSVIKQSKVISQRLFSTYPARSSYPSASGTSKKARFLQSPETATFPKGYLASAVHAGVKASSPSTKLDVALVVSDRPASAGAAFTRNVFQAAPVQVSRDILRKKAGKGLRAIAVNSGCANAVTGSQGVEDAWAMAKKVDGLLGEGEESSGTLVMSTGVIGQLLPIRKILNGLETSHSTLGSSYEVWLSVARAFMTTDTFPKLRTRSIRLPGSDQEVRFVGIDKGAGMIHPSMGPPSALPHATLLGFIATDANVEPTSLQNALTHAVDRSFNSISIDGDMSTNDTIIALANGASGSPEISEKGTPEDYEVFKRELTSFAEELAQLVVRDGEGATKFVKITVEVRVFPFLCHSILPLNSEVCRERHHITGPIG